jgi:hypothetical protein
MNTDSAVTAPPRLPNIPQILSSLIRQLSTLKSATVNADDDAQGTRNQPASDNSRSISNSSSNNRNRFSRLSPADLARAKSVMLTLHCMFPNELLLALDILDRRLVTQFATGKTTTTTTGGEEDEDDDRVYFVRSTSTLSTRGAGGPGPPKTYEVRLGSWNCTCPAFTLSAFREVEESTLFPLAGVMEEDGEDDEDDQDERSCWFGGTLTRGPSKSSPPMCKHLLACVLAGKCPSLFGQGVGETRDIAASEMAGWCAGYAE